MSEYGYMDYTKLFKLLEDECRSKSYLIKNGLNPRTVNHMVHNQPVNTETICKVCKIMNCEPNDIMTYVKGDN